MRILRLSKLSQVTFLQELAEIVLEFKYLKLQLKNRFVPESHITKCCIVASRHISKTRDNNSAIAISSCLATSSYLSDHHILV